MKLFTHIGLFVLLLMSFQIALLVVLLLIRLLHGLLGELISGSCGIYVIASGWEDIDVFEAGTEDVNDLVISRFTQQRRNHVRHLRTT